MSSTGFEIRLTPTQPPKNQVDEKAFPSTIVNIGGKLMRLSISQEGEGYVRLEWDRLATATRSYVSEIKGIDPQKVTGYTIKLATGKTTYRDLNGEETEAARDALTEPLKRLKHAFESMTAVSLPEKPPVEDASKDPTLARLTKEGAPLRDRDIVSVLEKWRENDPPFEFKLVQLESFDPEEIPQADQGKFLLPVHIGGHGGHFVAVTIDYDSKEITYYDSEGKSLDKRPELKTKLKELKKHLFDDEGQIAGKDPKTPKHQRDKYNCGRYVLEWFRQFLGGTDIQDHCQTKIPEKEILKRAATFLSAPEETAPADITIDDTHPLFIDVQNVLSNRAEGKTELIHMEEHIDERLADSAFKAALEATGEANLTFASSENFWGAGLSGDGNNHLGQLLMQKRS